MSTDSPAPDSDTPKKRPASGSNPAKGTETDLWDFDSDEPETTEPHAKDKKAESPGIPSRRVRESPIQSKKPKERHIDPPAAETMVPETDVDPPVTKKEPAKAPKPKGSPAAKQKPTPVRKPATEPEKPEPYVSESNPSESESAPSTETRGPSRAFLSSLSKTEKTGISVLLAILALGATLAIVHFSTRVPTRSVLSEDLDLPVEGKLVKVTAISTYWREPITTGENPDVVRRGTKLIPVVKVKIEAKSAAIRVLFRDEDGLVIGDPINRTFSGNAELRIPATAGFDDIGMHAAYRTGESPPWIVQILEAGESGVSIDNFKMVLETEISTDIR